MPVHRSCLVLMAALVTAAVTITPASAAPEAAALPPVPAGLTALESNAEDLVDDALGHDRARVIATASALSASAGPAAGKTLLAAGVPPKQIALVRARVARVARDAHAGAYVVVALDANAVSTAVTELYLHFADRVPIAVRRLDTIDRDAQLRSLAGQRAAVPLVVVRLEKTWAAAPAEGDRPRRADRGRRLRASCRGHAAPRARVGQRVP